MKTFNADYLISLIFTTRKIIREEMGGGKINPLSILKLKTLEYVEEKKNPTMRDVAGYLAITASSTTPLIDGLVASGQIKRAYDGRDRRIIRLVVTAKGKKNLKSGYRAMSGRLKKVLKKLNESELRNLANILKKLSNIYKK